MSTKKWVNNWIGGWVKLNRYEYNRMDKMAEIG